MKNDFTSRPEGGQEPARPVATETVPKIAVVAVHGVGNPAKDKTALSVTDLLLRFRPDGREYQPFRALRLHLPISPAPIGLPAMRTAGKGKKPAGKKRAFEMRTDSMREYHRDGAARAEDIGLSLMEDRLRGYAPGEEDQIYETIRCESLLLDGGRKPVCETHIYEMHWADLSSLGSGIVQAFVQLYNLLFDLCLLGRQTLDAVLAMHPDSRPLRLFRRLFSLSELLLVQPILLANVLMLLMVALLAVPLAPDSAVKWASYAFPPAVALVGLGSIAVVRHRKMEAGSWRWLIVPLGVVVAGVAALTKALSDACGAQGRLTACSLYMAALLAAAYFLGVWRYNRRRRGAMAVGGTLGALAFGFWFHALLAREPETAYVPQMHAVGAVIRTVEMLFTPLSMVWWAQWLLIVAIFAVSFLAIRDLKADRRERARLRRAAWTANLTLILPVTASLITTSCLWGAVLLTVREPLTGAFGKYPHNGHSLAAGLDQLVRDGAPVLPRALMFMGLAGLLAAWALAPAVWNEAHFPRRASEDSDKGASAWLGRNLTAGYRGMRVAGGVLQWLIVASTAWALARVTMGEYLTTEKEKAFVAPSLVVGGLAVMALLGARGYFKFLALGFYSVLQVAIDVVNWMRVHPLDNNPQARICARYASLLRHLFTSPTGGKPYDAVVIVAHSQGAVITADLLRYLNAFPRESDALKGDPLGHPLPIYLITMGCPLRQIYSIRFPHAYDWARQETPEEPRPAAGSLWSVEGWLNMYRSGDYVGRSLWHDEGDENTWKMGHGEPAGGKQAEFCVGAGAHTHYWDDPSGTVAREIHELVAHAAKTHGKRV